ncbi:hypothetical protein HUJ05_004587 [Dendroctonus ponderosae]|nr:hypothetical protein HUJ05_004587 [Dendroctonus ponderosae]
MFCRRLNEAAIQEYRLSSNSFQPLKQKPTVNRDAYCTHLFGVTINADSVSAEFRDPDKETVNVNHYDHHMASIDENCNDELIMDLTISSDEEDNVIEDETMEYNSDETVANFSNEIKLEASASEDAEVIEVPTGRRRRHHKSNCAISRGSETSQA